MNRYADVHVQMAAPPSPHFENLRFIKEGSEVQNAIDGRIATFNSAITASEARIADICKRREIDADEFTKDEDISSVGAKVGSYTESLGATLQAKGAIEKLTADMNQLRSETWGIIHARNTIATLARVKKNLQPDITFNLTLGEIEHLGF